jgi:hypothetical protein
MPIFHNASGRATFGHATTNNYRKTFFDAYPDAKGKVWVHHAVEQWVIKLYPGVVTLAEMHLLENLRGIPIDINPEIHLRKIRKIWDGWYLDNLNPTKEQLLEQATKIDQQFGALFYPPVR